MKFFSAFLIAIIVFLSCKQPEKTMEVTVQVRNNPQDQELSLVTMDYASFPLQLDTTLLKAGTAKVTLTTSLTEPGIYYLLFAKDNRHILLVNDLPGVTVDADWNNLSAYTVSSPASTTLKKLLTASGRYLQQADSLKKLYTQADLSDSLKNVYQHQRTDGLRELNLYLKQFTDTTTQAPVALYALGLLKQQQSDTAVLKTVTQNLMRRFPQNDPVKKFGETYLEYLAKEARTLSPGKKALVFSLPDSAGKQIALSEYVGKYTLVDFWASWCTPCRKENPLIVAAYNTYKDKNFTVFGVSLDKDKSAWLNAIEADQLNWQQVSDLKEWKSPIADLYNIEALPFNLLLDTTGTIIAMNLSGQELQSQLAKLLK